MRKRERQKRGRAIVSLLILTASAFLPLMQIPSLRYFALIFYVISGIFLTIAAYLAWRWRNV